MDLNKIMNDALQQIKEEGFVERVVEKQLKKTIEGIVEDIFNQWSDFSKKLKQEINSQLQIDFAKLDIPQYNQMVLNIVQERLNQALYVEGIEKIKVGMNDILGDPRKEYKLSELVEMMKEDVEDEEEYRGTEASLHIKKGGLLWFISLDPRENIPQYQCKYRFSIDGGTHVVHTIHIDDRKVDNRMIMGGLYGLEQLLFKMFTVGATLIVDEEDVDLCHAESDEEDWD